MMQLVDLLGRKAKEDSKQFLFYIFDDVSVEKKIKIIDQKRVISTDTDKTLVFMRGIGYGHS